jgi:hypothetical protein
MAPMGREGNPIWVLLEKLKGMAHVQM